MRIDNNSSNIAVLLKPLLPHPNLMLLISWWKCEKKAQRHCALFSHVGPALLLTLDERVAFVSTLRRIGCGTSIAL